MEVITKAKLAKDAVKTWQGLGSNKRKQVLIRMACQLRENTQVIIAANQLDLDNAVAQGISGSLLDRLILTDDRIEGMAAGLEEVAKFPDPIGEIVSGGVNSIGMKIEQVRVPLGVIGMIYEARPNVTADAGGLCLKAGNAVVLRGGSEAINSNKAIIKLLREALVEQGVTPEILQLIEDIDREQVNQMLRLNQYLDVIIPRGGPGLIKTVVENSTVPVIETGAGNCHIFVDQSADFSTATDIIINAKTQRPGVCNAVETVLVHQEIGVDFLPILWEKLQSYQVEVRGCSLTKNILPDVKQADDEDWGTEYLDLILAIKVVGTCAEAIQHIDQYSTSHSEAIITESYQNAEQFLAAVDSAAVYVNASTRFTDGAQFGLGTEIGISTQRLHARGPMGVKELTTTKHIIYGNGNVRS